MPPLQQRKEKNAEILVPCPREDEMVKNHLELQIPVKILPVLIV